MHSYIRLVILLGVISLSTCLYAGEGSNVRMHFSYGRFLFVENTGQITDQHYNLRQDIDFKLHTPGMDIFVGDGEVHYQFWNPASTKASAGRRDLSDGQAKGNFIKPGDPLISPNPGSIITYRLDVSLVGANKNAQAITEEKQDYYDRYYMGDTGEEGE